MKLSDVVKLYLLDMRVVPFTQKHIKEVDRELQRLLEWFETQGISQIEDVSHVHLKMYQIQLQDAAIAPSDRRISLRGRKFTAITVLGYMRKIRAFFSWCEKEGYLSGPNPMVRVPKVKIPSYVIAAFTPEQMDAMLNSCDLETALGFRDYTILLLLMDTGMRVSELCSLKISSLREGYLVVFGKGSKERELSLGPTSLRALYKYIYQHRKPALENEQHVFLSRTGHSLYTSDVRYVLRAVAKRAGIEGVRASPHTLRHSFAQQWLDKGGDIVSVSRLLGHTRLQTTEEYLKGFQSRQARDQHPKFSPVETNKLGRRHFKGKRGKPNKE